MSTKRDLIPLLIAGSITVALFALSYVPIIGLLGIFLFPTAVLVFLSVLAVNLFVQDSRAQLLVGCGLFLAVALGGVVSRWVDKLNARELYAASETIIAPLQVPAGTPVQVAINGPSVSSTGTIPFSLIAARTPTPRCERNSFDCGGVIRLKWMTEDASEQPYEALGSMGLRTVTNAEQIRLNIDVQEQPTSLRVTTELTNHDTLVARSVRHLPRAMPPESAATILWFWNLLENNLLTLMIGPRQERVPPTFFRDFLTRAVSVTPRAPSPTVAAQILERTYFDPPKVLTVGALRGQAPVPCPVRMSLENGYSHPNIRLWDEQRPIIAFIPMPRGLHHICTKEGVYVHGRSGSDIYIIERYDFDATLRWRHAVHFPTSLEHNLIQLSDLTDIDGRASARFDFADYQDDNEAGRRDAQREVLIYEQVSFSFPTTDPPSD